MIRAVLAAASVLFCSCPGRPHRTDARRVVSLAPSVTEIVYALGVERALVGNTNQCDYPAGARQVYKVGDFSNPDLERIVALRPSIVFATLPMHQALIEKLRELHVAVYVSQPGSIDDVFSEIELVGESLGAGVRAESLVLELKRRLDSVPACADTPGVYIEISSTPLMTVGSGTFINELVTRAGARNVFGTALQPYPVVDGSAVVEADPEVMLILHPATTAAEVRARIGWSRIKAVRTGRVYDGLDEDLFFRPGPRVVEGTELLARLLAEGAGQDETSGGRR